MRRPKLEGNAAFTSTSEEEERTMALRCHVKIKKNPMTAIIDTGTAVSIMTHKLMKKLELDIDEPSQIIIVTANGQRERTLGTIKNVPLIIQGILIKTTFQVIDSTDQTLLLKIDWYKKNKVNVDFENNEMILTSGLDKAIVPVQCVVGKRIRAVTIEDELDEMIEQGLEYEDEEETDSYIVEIEEQEENTNLWNETWEKDSNQSWPDEVETYEEEVNHPKYVLNILYNKDSIFLSIRKGEVMYRM